MVDWYFLHIDHETELVYHHQTCRAKHGGQIGSIGSLQDTDTMLNELTARLSKPEIDPIVCPNKLCSCGMCVPKAQNLDEYKKIFTEKR
jgi:hypothetical protein